MIRERQQEVWTGWLAEAQMTEMPAEIRSFACGLKDDDKAVQAALRLQWSNGFVEGQVNRLKTLKRQMYGRAGFELLRRRFLLAS